MKRILFIFLSMLVFLAPNIAWSDCTGCHSDTAIYGDTAVNHVFVIDADGSAADTTMYVKYTGPVRYAAYTSMLPRYNTAHTIIRMVDSVYVTVDKVPRLI